MSSSASSSNWKLRSSHPCFLVDPAEHSMRWVWKIKQLMRRNVYLTTVGKHTRKFMWHGLKNDTQPYARKRTVSMLTLSGLSGIGAMNTKVYLRYEFFFHTCWWLHWGTAFYAICYHCYELLWGSTGFVTWGIHIWLIVVQDSFFIYMEDIGKLSSEHQVFSWEFYIDCNSARKRQRD